MSDIYSTNSDGYIVCRFCGKLKQWKNVNSESFDKIVCRINLLGFNIIPLLRYEGLPKAICFPCKYEAEHACQFFTKVQGVQERLLSNFKVKNEREDLDIQAIDSAAVARREIKTETEQSDQEDEIDCLKGEPGDGTTEHPEKIEIEIKVQSIDYDDELAVAQNCATDHGSTRDDDGVSDQAETSDYDTHTRPIGDKTTSDKLVCANFKVFNDTDEKTTSPANNCSKEPRGSKIRKIPVNTASSLWNQYDWTCKHCTLKWPSIDALRSHSKSAHGQCYAFQCADCTETHINFKLFLGHVRSHDNFYSNICPYCDEKVNAADMSRHIENHVGRSKKACTACGEILNNKDLLQQHKEDYGANKLIKPPKVTKEFPCNICNKVFYYPSKLNNHKKIHAPDRKRDYVCDICGKSYLMSFSLTEHIATHDKTTERRFPCKICNQAFRFQRSLKNHLLTHSGLKPFICDHCDRRYRTKKQIKDHMKVHSDRKAIYCPICDKGFHTLHKLKVHSRQHTGIKPYSCEICARDFTDWGNWNKHMKRIHGKDIAKKKVTTEGVFPVNPETGQIINHQDATTEEWKQRILKPSRTPKNTQVV